MGFYSQRRRKRNVRLFEAYKELLFLPTTHVQYGWVCFQKQERRLGFLLWRRVSPESEELPHLRIHRNPDCHPRPISCFRVTTADSCLCSTSPGEQSQGTPKCAGNRRFGKLDKLSEVTRQPRAPALRHCEARIATLVTVSFFNSLDH